MKNLLNFIKHFGIFFFLTIVTQVGGLIYLLSLLINKKWNKVFKFKLPIIFCFLYLVFTFLVIPFVAPIFGREKVNHKYNIRPTNYLTVVLNRNYVKPEMNKLLNSISNSLSKMDSNIEIQYLDANFPFIDKFPLLPHLSHNDGKKIDISLVYQTPNGEITNKKKSISGYGVFAGPKNGEYDQIKQCKSIGYFHYDYRRSK